MRKLFTVGFALLLAGCASLKPDYTKPAVDLPVGWRDAPADGVQARDARWWKVYGDPVLDGLVDEALAHNANVMLAIARVDEARAALSATSADQRPQVSASAGRSRTRISQRGPTPLPPGVNPEFSDTRAAVGVSYEIDLWGRLRYATQAARADLLATEAARETVLITLTSDVAQGYFALRAFDGQLAATRRSLAARSEALSDLFTGPAGIWQAALAAGQPIYAGGRIDAQVQAAGARERQALAQYQLAIQNAFRDVRDALVAQAKARERLEAESERVTALRTTLRFARLRYQNGMTGQLEVLDAERNLLAAEQNRIDALRSQRAAIADLFKALGGAWS